MKHSLSQKFRLSGMLFFSGIFLGQYLESPIFMGIFMIFFGLSFFVWKWGNQKKFFSGIFFFGGLFWAQFFSFFFSPSLELSQNIGTFLSLNGTVDSYPEMFLNDIRFYARINEYSERKGTTRKSQEKILIILPKTEKNKEIQYGDVFSARGALTLPTSFSRKTFDYREYLLNKGVRSILKNPPMMRISEEKRGIKILRISQNLRNFFLRNIQSHIPTAHADIAMGMTLGSKSKLPKNIQTWFTDSGLQHILVVSGTNVMLVFLLVWYISAPLGKRISSIISCIVLTFFVLLAGADPPVLRAAIMGALVLLSGVLGRIPDLRNFLILAIFFLGFFNPILLQKSVSFFLSFMAMAGLICLTPVVFLWLQKFVEFSRYRTKSETKKNKLIAYALRIFSLISEKKALFLSVVFSAQGALFFVLLFFFGSFPVGGVFSNILIDPIVPFIMGNTILLGIISSVPFLGEISGFFLEKQIDLLFFIAEFFSTFPQISLPEEISLLGILFFLGFFIWAMFSQKYEDDYWRKFLGVFH